MFGGLSFVKSYLAVDLFFILSGVVVANAYEAKILNGMSLSKFMWIRLARLCPMLAVGTLIGLGISLFMQHDAPAAALFHYIMTVALIPNPDGLGLIFPLNGPAWSLFFEIAMNVIYFVAIRYLVGVRLFGAVLASGALIILAVVIYPSHNLDKGSTVLLMPIGMLRCFFSFYCGVLLLRHHRSRQAPSASSAPRQTAIAWGLLLLSAIVLIGPVAISSGRYWDILVDVYIFPFIVMWALSARPDPISVKLFKLCGVVSYPMYVLHEPIARLIESIQRNELGTIDYISAPTSGIVFLVGLIALAFFMSKHFEPKIRALLMSLEGDSPLS